MPRWHRTSGRRWLAYYTDVFLTRLNDHATEPVKLETVLPKDDRVLLLQHGFIVANPHPVGS